MNQFKLAISFLLLQVWLSAHAEAQETLRVMSFNIWVGGDAGNHPLSQTVKVIRDSKADIVGIQESHGHLVDGKRPDHGELIAKQLDWEYLQQGGRTAILSRFPIRSSTPRKWGAQIEYAPGKQLQFFNTHFAPSPYQPYQLLNIPYGKAPFIKTETDAIDWANRARGSQVDSLLSVLKPATRNPLPVVLTGDFNEPSYQDWTARAHAASLCPIKVRYPATRRITEAGMRDAYRAAHPDEVSKPGRTWTPITSIKDPKDRHDRIDYVFTSSTGVEVLKCEVVGEDNSTSDIVVAPWPSDHRAVLATIRILSDQ